MKPTAAQIEAQIARIEAARKVFPGREEREEMGAQIRVLRGQPVGSWAERAAYVALRWLEGRAEEPAAEWEQLVEIWDGIRAGTLKVKI